MKKVTPATNSEQKTVRKTYEFHLRKDFFEFFTLFFHLITNITHILIQEKKEAWEYLCEGSKATPEALQQARKEWRSLSAEQKKNMGNLIQLAVDVFTAGLEEEIEIREEWKNKIFVKLLIQEWVSTKETMKLLVKALDE
jgi:hypothetical protein